MLRHLVPPSIRRPFARDSHAVRIPPGARPPLVSGQLGVSVEDVIPESVEAQAALCQAAIYACLADPSPASTLMIVAGFTRPEFKVEFEALAATID
ncbi:RidA family protein [Ancylobacter dichloromethanicus]|uniref:Enamine deaminase RidA n=1 Tax=Ancylobacter dichloromethanicus TaxID=518825 RepID=A0A9W6J7G2_9HYPH|nr:RidA family protein [Ancylobacter dichloromethanicus]MBS7555507.1 RidA family protein [Ancylobacter dichloromethanicus]GLK70703.1 enamine deaminase RidA [Ancylobacter dichloromethanicus]